MKKAVLFVSVLGVFLILHSCSNEPSSKENVVDNSKYYLLGNEISAAAQGALIQNLSKAIEEGGHSYAVGFCNLKAMQVIDSISLLNTCVVSRITDLNRNQGNKISNEGDKKIWDYYKGMNREFPFSDTIVENTDNIVYYKPIKIGMPTCLKCHGTPGKDIDPATLAVIDSLYPLDLARNYMSGDLRGLWKIEFLKSIQ